MMRRIASVGALLLTACVVDTPEPSDATEVEDDPRCFGSNAAAVLESEPDERAAWSRVHDVGATMDRATFARCYAPEPNLAQLPYDPLAADYLDEISARLWMRDDQTELLAQNGFVVLNHIEHKSFETAYSRIYDGDLPVLITSDSLLYALHRSFDSILQDLEMDVLEPELALLLEQLHGELARLELPPELEPAARELDVYLAVARSLLSQHGMPTHGGAETDQRVEAIRQAVAARQPMTIELFGALSMHDFSQYEPRGHYTEGLEAYFQTMIWLGRTELALVRHDDGDGTSRLERRGVEATVLLGELLDRGGREHWDRIESVLRPLLGEPDSMSAITLDAFRSDAGLDDLDALVRADDAALQAVLGSGQYGVQRILSQIIYTNGLDPQYEPPQVFALFGQRFAIDSYVLHATTYDRIIDPTTGQKTRRMLPHEFDIAFALGSNVAGELLADELEQYAYQGVLHDLRFLIDGHGEDFWRESIYNGWLHAIRALDEPTEQAEYPAAMRTEAWAHKTLETQLASWAELRHDTIAYTKQSYSGGISCEYPQAYVEPVPSFYARMGELARQGSSLADSLIADGHDVPRLAAYFEHMADVMARLERIAGKELDGVALDDDEWHFLRTTIEAEEVGCGDQIAYNGWYGQLLYDREEHGDFSPTIADVHTAPTDAHGKPVGWVLHAATGFTRYMVFTVEDCSGVRAYVGPVSTFHRRLTEGYQRLDDNAWATELWDERPAPPAWTQTFAR